MTIGDIGKCKVEVAPIDMSVNELANLMKEKNIGDIVVVEESNKPIGVITDRDIVVKLVANDVDPHEMSAGDIMSRDLLILKAHQGVQEALDMMSARGVRRAPIVNDHGSLVGIIAADDLAVLLADELHSYGKLLRKQMWSARN